MIEIIGFCRHKLMGWEGVIYKKEGTSYVTSGVAHWELTPSRDADLERVGDIDLHRLCSYLDNVGVFGQGPEVSAALKEKMVS